MRRLVFTALSAGVLVTSGIVAGAQAQNPIAPVDGGTGVQGCYSAGVPNPAGEVGCHFAQNVTNQAAAECRVVDDANDNCSIADGREISSAQMTAFMHSWVHRALSLQDALTSTAPLLEEQLVHTHNSFNSSAYSTNDANGDGVPSYYPTLTNQDPNQVYSLTDQLDMGVRAIELDLHWVPSPYGTTATHGYWVTLCHGDGQEVPNTGAYAHVGCTADRPAQDGFAEVRRWLNAHQDQVLLIYLENQLYPGGPIASQQLGQDTAAALLDSAFGNLIYKPTDASAGHCATLPYTMSRASVLAAGARVLLVGNCGPSNAWAGDVFERGTAWNEQGDPSNYTQQNCSDDAVARANDSSFRRIYQDSTFLTAATSKPQSLTPDTVAEMVRCGVNIIGMDQLMPQDGRLAAYVWSWAKDEPSSAGCAYQGSDGRFHSSGCDANRHYACVDAANGWHVTAATGPWQDGATACNTEFAGSTYSVPVNGYRNALLQTANAPGDAWLNYAALPGPQWRPNIAPLTGPTVVPQSPPPGHAYGRGHGRGRPPHNASLD